MPRQVSRDYDRLKALIISQARQDLAGSNRRYVETFQRVLFSTEDLDEAIRQATPALPVGGARVWPAVLTAFFDFELVRGKVSRCHAHLKEARDSEESDAGYWFAYHLDHWIFQTDAFLERCEALFKRVIRAAIRPRDPDGWERFQDSVSTDLKVLKDRVGKIRDPLARSLGGGVAGLAEHGQWESVLAAPFAIFEKPDYVQSTAPAFFGSVDIARRRRWFRWVHRVNLALFAYSEAFSRRLLDKIESLPST